MCSTKMQAEGYYVITLLTKAVYWLTQTPRQEVIIALVHMLQTDQDFCIESSFMKSFGHYQVHALMRKNCDVHVVHNTLPGSPYACGHNPMYNLLPFLAIGSVSGSSILNKLNRPAYVARATLLLSICDYFSYYWRQP